MFHDPSQNPVEMKKAAEKAGTKVVEVAIGLLPKTTGGRMAAGITLAAVLAVGFSMLGGKSPEAKK